MYQALYRKYRPQTFDDVIGQDHITQTLKNQVMTDHLSHAYIFIGTRGTGKTTCARILAKAVNCEHPVNGNPCLDCSSCEGIADGSVMDVVELDAASNNGVDNVRLLRDEAVFSPASVKKRVYIIDEVHMLSVPAFNALLKILEEPPEHLIFILATTELQKVPATILSRCQRHIFKRVSQEELTAYLETIAQKERIDLSHDAAALLAGLGEGSVRDSLSLLDQCSSFDHIGVDEVYSAVGLAGNKRISNLFSDIAHHRPEEALAEFDAMWTDGKDPAVVLKELSNLSRDILVMKVAPKSCGDLIYGGYDRAFLNQLASELSVSELCRIGEKLSKTLSSLSSPKMDAELALVRLSSGLPEETERPVVYSVPQPAKEQPKNIPDFSAPEEMEKPAVTYAVPADKTPETCSRTESAVAEDPHVTEGTQPEREEEVRQDEETVPEQPRTAKAEWKDILSKVIPKAIVSIQPILNDSNSLRGTLDGAVLHLQVAPGFYYDCVNKPATLQLFADAASQVCGRDITVKISEMKPGNAGKEKRNLDELRQFAEVTFTS